MAAEPDALGRHPLREKTTEPETAIGHEQRSGIHFARVGDRPTFFGVCSCGWRSMSGYSTAGMAGAAFDTHAGESGPSAD